MKKLLRLAIFISGGGTTSAAIITACKKGKLKVNPVLVVASKSGIAGIERVIKAGLASDCVKIVNPKKYSSKESFGDRLITLCKKFEVDLIGQYGWLPLTPVNLIKEYGGKIVNQHPGPLDPPRADFGGKGMYGRRVHCAVLYFRRKTNHDFWTEATTHLVSEGFDKGQVIKSQKINILPDDTVESLQKKVLPIEHLAQIEALKDILSGSVNNQIRREPLIKKIEMNILNEAKQLASVLYPHG